MVNAYLNASISHNSNDWLMWVTIESERTKKGPSLEKRCWSKTQFYRFEVQILASKEKSESVLQPRHCSVFNPYLGF
jgi:hypothetical protein